MIERKILLPAEPANQSLGPPEAIREGLHFPFAIFHLSFVICAEFRTTRSNQGRITSPEMEIANDKWKMENVHGPFTQYASYLCREQT